MRIGVRQTFLQDFGLSRDRKFDLDQEERRRVAKPPNAPGMIVDMDQTQTDSEVGLTAAAAGAAVARRHYQQTLARYDKSPIDFATQADLEAEEAIREVIRAARPADTVVGEELGESTGQDTERRWLVDPLCGTLNYAAGTPLASVNVALLTSGGVRAAASADPIADECFWSDGAQSWLRRVGGDTKLIPSAASRLIDINCDGDGEFVGPQLVADRELRSRYGPRVLSSTLALAWVAGGRHAGYITDGDLRDSVHFTAGIAICQTAGCTLTDLVGDPVYTGRGLVAAADPATHKDLLRVVSKHL
jgi:fructose-1,6-bisphosphatase/inositol monophosphatase family enzyme